MVLLLFSAWIVYIMSIEYFSFTVSLIILRWNLCVEKKPYSTCQMPYREILEFFFYGNTFFSIPADIYFYCITPEVIIWDQVTASSLYVHIIQSVMATSAYFPY